MKLADRFWSKVDIGAIDECWEWQAAIAKVGYGAFNYEGQQTGAHRVAYMLHYGDIPEGKEICHRCHNRPCCNPHHLYAGTRKDNVRDAMKAGTFSPPPHYRGDNHPMSKMTWDDVQEIRKDYNGDWGDLTRIANKKGITPAQVKNIVDDVHWIEDRP